MRGRSGILRFVLLALLLAPGACSQALGPLSASHATLAGGGVVASTLAGLVIEDAACAGASALSLSATRGVLTIENETAEVWARSSVGTARNNTNVTETVTDARADGFVLREGCRLLVLPLDKAQVEATGTLGGGELRPPIGQARPFDSRSSFNRSMEIAAGALPFQPVQPAAMTLHGPFRLVVWQASFLLHDDNGTREVQTGEDLQPIAPGPVPLWRRVQREAYFDVEAGTLAVSLTPAVQVYMASLRLDLQSGRLLLHDPEGVLPISDAPVPFGSRLLELESPTTALLAPSGGRLGADVRADPPVAYLDGVAIRPDPPARWVTPLVLAVLAAAVLAWAVHRASGNAALRRMDRVGALLEAHRYDQALALAGKAKAHRATREDARLAEVTCLIQTSRLAEARDALAAGGWSTATDPLREYLLAIVEAGSGQKAAATTHLAQCLLKAPSFATEALAHPLLATVVRDALAANRPPVPGESYA